MGALVQAQAVRVSGTLVKGVTAAAAMLAVTKRATPFCEKKVFLFPYFFFLFCALGLMPSTYRDHAEEREEKEEGMGSTHTATGSAVKISLAPFFMSFSFAIVVIFLCVLEAQVFDPKSIIFSQNLSEADDYGVHHYGLERFLRHSNLSQIITSKRCEYMDVVFSWANGTDPAYIASWESAAHRKMDNYGKLRSTDHGTLRFAIRSVVANVPFMRNLILVTNNQVPSWIKRDVPNLRIVSIDDIFSNRSHLPSFNSNSIESNLQNIPGLSECFLYMCDDYFISRKVALSDFEADDGRPKLCTYV